MANFDMTTRVQIGGAQNGGNSHLMDVIDSSVLPYAWCPELAFEQTLKWTDLVTSTSVAQVDAVEITADTGAGVYSLTFTDARTGDEIDTVTYTVHEDTITIGGTASDGNYDVIFPTTPPTRVRVVRSTTPATNDNIATQLAANINDVVLTDLAGMVASASANASVVTIVYEAGIDPVDLDTAQTTATGTIVASVAADDDAVAAGLEAAIEAARATTLAGWVDNETVNTNDITITYEAGVQVELTADFPGAGSADIVVSNTATIAVGSTGNLFPANVWVDGAIGNVTIAFETSGAPDPVVQIEVGDANDVDGLMTSSNLTDAGPIETIAAAEFDEHFETAFVPILTITSDRPFPTLTAGSADIMIRYTAPLTCE